MCQLGSWPRVDGRLGSGVWVNVIFQIFGYKAYSDQKNELAKTILAVQCIYTQVILDKLNLLRLCSEKTIFKLFILERAEYKLFVYLLYDSLLRDSIEFFNTTTTT